MRPAPFIGHWQTHSEIVALRGEHTVCGVATNATNVKTVMMIRTNIRIRKHISDTNRIGIVPKLCAHQTLM